MYMHMYMYVNMYIYVYIYLASYNGHLETKCLALIIPHYTHTSSRAEPRPTHKHAYVYTPRQTTKKMTFIHLKPNGVSCFIRKSQTNLEKNNLNIQTQTITKSDTHNLC